MLKRVSCSNDIQLMSLLLKNINYCMSGNIGQQLQHADLLSVKKRLFASPDHRQQSNGESSAAKKSAAPTPILRTPNRKIHLKRHLKTELSSLAPHSTHQPRLRTSPHHPTANHFASHSPYKGSAATDAYLPRQSGLNRLATQFTEIYPSKKNSLAYSNILQRRSASKSKSKELSLSKKKMMFTVYSKEKNKQASPKPPKIQYEIPYRYHHSITINLFDSVVAAKTKRSKSKSLGKGFSPAKSKLSHFGSPFYPVPAQDARIAPAFERIKQLRFVFEYISQAEIMKRLREYAFSAEPECRWPLLIVDQIFKKQKREGGLQLR